MKTLSQALQLHLNSGTTTLAWCWKLVRRDGLIQGFTDHDRDLIINAVSYEAAAGFTASEIKDTVGLAVDNLEVASALSSSRLDEHDLAAGLYDDADVEIWRVNWADPSQRVLMRTGTLGEVTRTGQAFTAEVRGLAHTLNIPQGRVYQYTCDADLGDSRCGVALANSTLTATAMIASVSSARQFAVTGLDGFATDWFTRGLAAITSGANTNARVEIRRHTRIAGTVRLDLWQPLAHAPVVGDALIVTAGCDKHFATCGDKFSNSMNFRGFPHLPGTAVVIAVARSGDANDGSALR
jgi:uncharacterized phage protein (TIGR02218 family)